MPRPEAIRQRQPPSSNLKECVMDEETELDIVDLGDAKETTKGILLPGSEDNVTMPGRQIA